MADNYLREFILKSLAEDIGEGDHSSLASIPFSARGKAKLIVKQDGILAGTEVAREVFITADPEL